MLTIKVAVVKSHHSISVKSSQYRDTGPTDPSLIRTYYSLIGTILQKFWKFVFYFCPSDTVFKIMQIYSPSGTVLRSHEEVCDYITAENTCKCGLLCPLRVETCFNFDV